MNYDSLLIIAFVMLINIFRPKVILIN